MVPSQVENLSLHPTRGGKRSGAGRKGKRHRNADLVSTIRTELKTIGAADESPKLVRSVVRDICLRDPTFCERLGLEEQSIVRAYFKHRNTPSPPTEPRDQWISDLGKWGESPEASRALVDRWIAIVTIKLPNLGLAYLTRMFAHVKCARRLRTGQSKIERLKRAADNLESDRPYPLRPWDQGSKENIELIKSALRNGLTDVQEIADHTGIKPRTTQELLAFMANVGDAVRLRHGHYGPAREGATNSTPPGKVILRLLEDGPASSADLRARGNLSEAQVFGALHRLVNITGQVVRLKPDLYALPGAAAVPHVYAHDAIILALRSGKKSMPELIEITDKNRAELWAALRRRLLPDGLVKQVGFRSGHAVRPGFRGRVAVFALIKRGRQSPGPKSNLNSAQGRNQSLNSS